MLMFFTKIRRKKNIDEREKISIDDTEQSTENPIVMIDVDIFQIFG